MWPLCPAPLAGYSAPRHQTPACPGPSGCSLVLSQTDGARLAASQLIYHAACVCKPSAEDLGLARGRHGVNMCRVAVLRSSTALCDAGSSGAFLPAAVKGDTALQGAVTS